MTLAEILSVIGKESEAEFPELGDDDGVVIKLPNGLEISVEEVSDQDGFYFYAELGELPSREPLEAMAFLLEANTFGAGTGGASLGLDLSSGVVTLSQAIWNRSVTVEDFLTRFDLFSVCASTWRETLSGDDPDFATLRFEQETRAPEPTEPDIPGSGFMAV